MYPITTVQLGSFTFNAFEVPDAIPWGGDHKLTVHKLPGGGRVIDAMGRDDEEITWKGRFLGGQADLRARALDNLRVQGQALTLTWGQHRLAVIIRSFKPCYELDYNQGYSISLTVLQDLTQPVGAAPPASIDQALGGDLTSSLGLGALINNPALSSALGQVQATIGQVASVVGLSTAKLLPIQQAIGAAQTGLFGLAQLNSGNLAGLGTLGGLIPGDRNGIGGARLTAAVGLAQQAPMLANLGSNLGRMAKNLGIGGS